MDRDQLIDGTMILAVHGELVPHRWVASHPQSPDVFNVFAARSVAMGWSAYDADGLGRELWGMNDAGGDLAGGGSLLSWFQVGLPEQLTGDVTLPVAPLVDGGWSTTERFGEARISAVQVLVPMQLFRPAAGYIASGLPQFHAATSPDPLPVQVAVDSSEDDDHALRLRMLAAAAEYRFAPFGLEERDTAPGFPVPAAASIFDLRMGEVRSRVEFVGEIPEWTAPAVAWLILIVAQCARRAGLRTPAVVTVARRPA